MSSHESRRIEIIARIEINECRSHTSTDLNQLTKYKIYQMKKVATDSAAKSCKPYKKLLILLLLSIKRFFLQFFLALHLSNHEIICCCKRNILDNLHHQIFINSFEKVKDLLLSLCLRCLWNKNYLYIFTASSRKHNRFTQPYLEEIKKFIMHHVVASWQ